MVPALADDKGEVLVQKDKWRRVWAGVYAHHMTTLRDQRETEAYRFCHASASPSSPLRRRKYATKPIRLPSESIIDLYGASYQDLEDDPAAWVISVDAVKQFVWRGEAKAHVFKAASQEERQEWTDALRNRARHLRQLARGDG